MSVLSLHHITDTTLWKHLNSGFSGADSSTATLLAGHLKTICEEAYQRMKAFPSLHPQYTLHDENHLLRVTELMSKVLGEDVLNVLNPVEVALLILAAHFHDQGMVLSSGELNALSSDQKYLLFRRGWIAEHPALAETQNDLKQSILDDTTLNTLLFTEKELLAALHTDYIRTTHGQRSATYVLSQYGSDERWKISEVNLASIVARLSLSHVKPAADLNSSNGFFYDESVGTYTINTVFLGIILRLADILDFDRDRTPDSLYRSINFTSPVSLLEWEKHRSVTGWVIDSNLVRFTAYCEHPEYERAVRQFMDWIDKELADCHTLVKAFPKAAERYQLFLPLAVNRERIGPKDRAYIYHDLEFSLSRDQIVKLLMTDQLYGTASLCVRELLQNALDAIRLRRAIILRDTEAPWAAGRVKFEHFVNEHGYEIVRCTDNGAGMDEEIITKFLTSVGRSYYRSPEFEQERHSLQQADADFEPIGQFGIGFMSCFMLGDTIKVYTKKEYGYGRGHGPSLLVEINGLGGIVAIKESPTPLNIGTTIEINCGKFKGALNYFRTKAQVVETISAVTIATEFPVAATCTIPENVNQINIPASIFNVPTPQEGKELNKIKTISFDFNSLNSLLQGTIKESFLVSDDDSICISNEESTIRPAEARYGANKRTNPQWLIHNKEGRDREAQFKPIGRISFDGIYICGKAQYKPSDNRGNSYNPIHFLHEAIHNDVGQSTFTLNVKGNLKAALTPARAPLNSYGRHGSDWSRLENFIRTGQARIYEELIAQNIGKVDAETYWRYIAYNGLDITYFRMGEAWKFLAIPCTSQEQEISWIPLSEIGDLTISGNPEERSHVLYTKNNLQCRWEEGALWQIYQSGWHSDYLTNFLLPFCTLNFDEDRYIISPKQPEQPNALVASKLLYGGKFGKAVLMPYVLNLHEAITTVELSHTYNSNHPVIKFIFNSLSKSSLDIIEEFCQEILSITDLREDIILKIKEGDIPSSYSFKRMGILYKMVKWDEYPRDLWPPYKIHASNSRWIELDSDFFNSL